ncbi:MAG: hypothetical protein CBB68_01000 [Rhodospirillaceae bacterium TMED8]|nr:hypothetical protein [Magnetovibrio sp.]OUT53257.1 MAG: hypothetical protein CBB68_01000 [Rhodospirillaceae bacterium TMED8]
MLAEIQGHTFYLPALSTASVVFDLGAAGAGFAQEINRRTGCICHCAEASPVLIETMARGRGIHHHHVAICGKDGPFKMTVGGRDKERYWVKWEGASGISEKDIMEVPGLTLESFYKYCTVDQVDLIKVDIEGAEFSMFDSVSDETICRAAQWTIEFHDFIDPSLTPKVLAIIQRMRQLGYADIIMTRHAHGDVLFLDTSRLKINSSQLFYMRSALKYSRGVRRMLSRLLDRLHR